jgi:hypothetical protein
MTDVYKDALGYNRLRIAADMVDPSRPGLVSRTLSLEELFALYDSVVSAINTSGPNFQIMLEIHQKSAPAITTPRPARNVRLDEPPSMVPAATRRRINPTDLPEVGDMVRSRIDKNDMTPGRIYVVREVDRENRSVLVMDDANDRHWLDQAGDFELVGAETIIQIQTDEPPVSDMDRQKFILLMEELIENAGHLNSTKKHLGDALAKMKGEPT